MSRLLGSIVSGLTRKDQRALTNFVNAGRKVSDRTTAFNVLGNKGDKFTAPQRKFISNITDTPFDKISPKTGDLFVPFGGKRFGHTDETKENIATAMANVPRYPMMPSLGTYERQLATAANQFGHSIRDVKANPTKYPEVYAAVQFKRGESLMFPNKKTSYPKVFEKSGYSIGDVSGIINQRSDLVRNMMDTGTFKLFDELGIMSPGLRAGSIDHTAPLFNIRKGMLKSARPLVFDPKFNRGKVLDVINNPKFMFASPNIANIQKRGIESFLYNPIYKNRNLQGVGDILEEASMTTNVLNPKNLQMTTFGTGKPVDIKQFNEYLNRVIKDQPYGVGSTGKTLTLPTLQYLRRNFFRGGIASLLE